jgi:hypothetical protein
VRAQEVRASKNNLKGLQILAQGKKSGIVPLFLLWAIHLKSLQGY